MRDLRGVNPLLLVVTVASLIVATVSLMQAPQSTAPVDPNQSAPNRSGHAAAGVDEPHASGEAVIEAVQANSANAAGTYTDASAATEWRESAESARLRSGIPAPGDGRITGVVYGTDGAPAPTVRVAADPDGSDMHLYFPSATPADVRADFDRRRTDELRRLNAFATTDSKGQFELTGLVEGLRYRISASDDRGNRGALDDAAVAGEHVVLLLYAPGPRLTGVVRSRDGQPVDHFTILTRDLRGDGPPRRYTDPEGRFEMSYRPWPGFEIAAYSDGLIQLDWVAVPPSESPTVELVLDVGADLFGVITNKAGDPVAGAEVWLDFRNELTGMRPDINPTPFDTPFGERRGRRADVALTDGIGAYRFATLRPARYTMRVRYGSIEYERAVALEPGPNPVDIGLDTGARLYLTAVPPQGVYPQRLGLYFTAEGAAVDVAMPMRERPNEFIYDGLPRAVVTLVFSQQGYSRVMFHIDLTSGEAHTTLPLKPSTSVSGSVKTTTGHAVSRPYVLRLVRPGDPLVDQRTAVTQPATWPEADGAFTIGDVEPGTWEATLTLEKTIVHRFPTLVTVGQDPVTGLEFIYDPGTWLRLRIRGGHEGRTSTLTLMTPTGERTQRVSVTAFLDLYHLEAGEHEIALKMQVARGNVLGRVSVTVRAGFNEAEITLTPPDCVRVVSVTPESAAAQAGLQPGDLIVRYFDHDVENVAALEALAAQTVEESAVAIVVLRDGDRFELATAGGPLGAELVDAQR